MGRLSAPPAVLTDEHDLTAANRLRWLAVSAGITAGIGGTLPFGPLFFIFPSPLIVGAIIQSRSPRLGSWMMRIGSTILSYYIFIGFTPQIVEFFSRFRAYSDDFLRYIALALWVSSFVLVGWCDFVLLAQAVRSRSRN
jgi:hypothetical protein